MNTQLALFLISLLFFALAIIVYKYLLIKKSYLEIQKQNEFNITDLNNGQLYGKAKYSELGLISAGITHEINNALSVIIGRTSQLLRIHHDHTKVKEVAEGLQQIMYTSERAAKAVKGYREFMYADAEKSPSEIQLKDLLDDLVVLCGQRLKNHGIDLRIHALEGIHIMGFKAHLEQALLNLINNSIDAIDHLSDKWIEISAVESTDSVTLFFKDSGPGIPAEIKNRIMDPLFTTKKQRGTGLGLPFVKAVAAEHGGNFSYADNFGNTTFLLEIPTNRIQSMGNHISHLTQ